MKHGNTQFFGKKENIDPSRFSEKSNAEGLLKDSIVDDAEDFGRLFEALKAAGILDKRIEDIWNTVAAVLHLGNISFEEKFDDNRGGCRVSPDGGNALETAAALLGLEVMELRVGLVSRIMQATKGGVLGTPHEANAARDALAKAIYSRLFDWLVNAINKSINQSEDGKIGSSANFIGALDIAGFEFFGVNSFEQFCINYCNEKLQNFFNGRILNKGQELYKKEGLNVPRIEYSDNQDCIDLFEKKGSGLFDLLDDEARLPKASPQHFTTAALDANKGHFRIEMQRKSKLKSHRDKRYDDGFLSYFAGTVCYHTQQFLEKNNNQLHHSLEILIEQSSVVFLRSLFETPAVAEPPLPGKRGGSKLQAASDGNKNVLIGKLTEPTSSVA